MSIISGSFNKFDSNLQILRPKTDFQSIQMCVLNLAEVQERVKFESDGKMTAIEVAAELASQYQRYSTLPHRF